MEQEDKTNALSRWLADPTVWIAIFAGCYLAVLPMADTIALRNLALFGVLVCLAWQWPKIRGDMRFGLPVWLWAAYLMVFPVFASDHATAWQSLGGQWGRGLLALVAGAGVASLLASRKTGAASYLGLVSAVPILVHLSLFSLKSVETASISWGYWGRETHHADLGYAAGQAVMLLTASLLLGRKTLRPWAMLLMVACLLSTALAQSRAGLAFALLGAMLVFGAFLLVGSSQKRLLWLASLAGILMVGLTIVGVAAKEDPRWRNMFSGLEAGFLGNAIEIQCFGTSSIEPQIQARFGSDAKRLIYAIQDGDGARMVALRAGATLAVQHPWGLDGSRQAFQTRLRQACPDPVISMAHTHDGWLDTVLAIGWVGALLWAAVLIHFFSKGAKVLLKNGVSEWTLLLVSIPAFWFLRGFTDSVFRDHMLEMQGFMLAYAATAMRVREKAGRSSDSAKTTA